jgi:hypothetical protein
MGKLKSLEIELNNPMAVFHIGQAIEGQVVIELNEEMKMKGNTTTTLFQI